MDLSALPFLQNEPEISEYLAFEWQAFDDLGRDRPIGFSIGPIPWSSIERYAVRHSMGDDEFERFQNVIYAMDAVYLEHHRNKAEQEKAKAKR